MKALQKQKVKQEHSEELLSRNIKRHNSHINRLKSEYPGNADGLCSCRVVQGKEKER